VSIYTFEEHYVPRMWGGGGLRRFYGKPTPDETIGEAWLISDHPHHSSITNRGPERGKCLHELLNEQAEEILGGRSGLTVHGRFPLLLKILDAQRDLSIQVHPDDALAAELGENDIGKNEMWHILHAKRDTLLYCGLTKDFNPSQLESTIESNRIADYLKTLPTQQDKSVFVPAGTIHSIGAGCVLAEIQQNSDLTYRIDDWGRVQNNGTPRELHREKAFKAIRYPNTHPGTTPMHNYLGPDENTTIQILAACKHFATEELLLNGPYRGASRGDTFHIFLGKTGATTLSADGDVVVLAPGQAALVPAHVDNIQLQGESTLLHYYVPDVEENIVAPLSAVGYSTEDIERLLY